MANLFLTPRAIVTVNGIARRTIGGSTSCGFRTAFPTASIAFASDESPAEPGDRIVVVLGYLERGTQVVFTGEADDDTLDYWPNNPGVQATGILARMQRGLGIESGTATPDPETGEIPAYEAIDITDKDIVEALCLLYGIPAGDIQGADPPINFATLDPIRLGKNQPAWGLVSELDRLTFLRTFGAPDGTTRRLPINGIPGGAAFTLTQGVDPITGSRSRSRRGIVNWITMLGKQDAGGPGLQPKAERFADSPYIPTPPRYQSEEWASELAETEEICDFYATNRLGQTNRLSEAVSVRISYARPDIYPAMSLAISSPKFKYDARTVFWVEQVDHAWDSNGISTTLGLLAASAAAGLNPNQAPVALITIVIEREHLADGTDVWVVFASGIDSYDPDGVAIDVDPQHGIATYLWSGSPNSPVTPAALPRATYVYTTNPTGATITLTVADTSLKTGTATVTLTATQVDNAPRRDLWAAVEVDLFLTTDGGVTWRPTGVPARVIAEIAHPLYQLAAENSGALHRVTVDARGDFVVEDIATPANVTALHINIGIDGKGTGRAWAGGNGGETYLSTDDGQTWAARGTIANIPGSSGPAIRHIEESPFSFGTLYAISGPAMWLSFDEGVTWTNVRAYPDVALTGTRMASGRFADIGGDKSYHWASFAGASANLQQRLLEQADLVELDWPIAAKPAQPTGLTMGAQGPELYVVDTVDGGRSWYIEDFTGGGELEQRGYDTAMGEPHHIIRDPDFDGVVYGAAETAIFKTFDKFISTAPILNLGAGLHGWMVGYGKLRLPIPVLGNLVWHGSTANIAGDRWIYRLTASGFSRVVSPLDSGSKSTSIQCPLIATTGGSLLVYSYYNGNFYRQETDEINAFRSTDGGITWSDTGLRWVINIQSGPDGVVYAMTHPSGGPLELHRSDNNGATWAVVQTFAEPGMFFGNTGVILAHPTDSLIVTVKTLSQWYLSMDGGGSFTATGITTGDTAGLNWGTQGGYSPDGDWYLWYLQGPSAQEMYRADANIGGTKNFVSGTNQSSGGATVWANIFVNHDGIAYNYGDGDVLASDDQGASWSPVIDAARLPSADPSWAIFGLAPGDAINDWYALPNRLDGIALIRRTFDADATLVWEDLTPALLLLYPDQEYYCFWGGAARL